MAGTNYNATFNDLVNISLTSELGYATQAECVGNPNASAVEANVYENGCIMRRTDVGTGNVLYENSGTLALPVWTVIGGGGGGAPSLPVNSVQFNNAGAFGGSAQFTWDDATTRLVVGSAGDALLDINSAAEQIIIKAGVGGFQYNNIGDLSVIDAQPNYNVQLGDIDGGGFNTRFQVADGAQIVQAFANNFSVRDTVVGNTWFNTQTLIGLTRIGDLGSFGNDTMFTIDDVNQTIQATVLINPVGPEGTSISVDTTSASFGYTNGANVWAISAESGGVLRIIANGVDWVWPNADGAGSSALTTDGAGTLSWQQFLPYTLPNTQILVGNAGNVATPVNMSGEATIANTGVVTLADSVKVYTTRVDLNAVNILALGVTPVTLLPAPGAGKCIVLLDVTGRINFGTTAYVANTDLAIQDATTGNDLFTDGVLGTGTLLPSVATRVGKIPAAFSGTVIITENGAVNISAPSGNPTVGDGTLNIYLTYKIITL